MQQTATEEVQKPTYLGEDDLLETVQTKEIWSSLFTGISIFLWII